MDVKESIAQAAAEIITQVKSTTAPKEGYKTTEFGVVGVVVSYLIGQDVATGNWYYAATAAALAFGYSALRALIKKG